MFRRGRVWLGLIGAIVYVLLLGAAPAAAASANLSHSYQALGTIRDGSLVSLDQTQSSEVEAANSDNGARLVGVAVDSNDSLLAVNPGAAPAYVQVAIAGSASVLVSSLNGDIHVGDQVGVSPFSGIGIKALPGTRVIGVAQTAFDAQTAGAKSEQVTDKNGNPGSITVGYAEVSIGISTSAAASSGNLNALQITAKNLTGHTVSTIRVVVGLTVAIITSLALITLIYASIYGSIISVGRNPLAKYAVFRTLSSVLGLALATAVVAGLTIFLLLS